MQAVTALPAESDAKWIVEGTAVVSSKTKRLLGQDLSDSIAVIDHEDVDETAAEALVASRVKAIINASSTFSGTYPTKGPLLLLRERILICEIDRKDLQYFRTGSRAQISDRFIRIGTAEIHYRPFDERNWLTLYQKAQQNVEHLLSQFIDNTLEYARVEKELILKPLKLPPLSATFAGRHALIVARGNGCQRDLQALADYILRNKPLMVGVDGGADLLLEAGYRPEIIIGDMDSVSDAALNCGAELVVHGYLNGTAPGHARIREMGLEAHIIHAVGTSEDVAVLLADQAGAELIVTLGLRKSMIDFLEKGRKGMGSSLLTRLKVGGKLIDAAGIQTFYGKSEGAGHVH